MVNQDHQDDRDFWQGVRLMSSGLIEAAKKASYSVGCGAGGLGLALWGVTALGVTGPAALLIPMGAFFLLARIGRVLDEWAERRSVETRLEEIFMIQQRINDEQQKALVNQYEELKRLLDSNAFYITMKNQKALEELGEKIDKKSDTNDFMKGQKEA